MITSYIVPDIRIWWFFTYQIVNVNPRVIGTGVDVLLAGAVEKVNEEIILHLNKMGQRSLMAFEQIIHIKQWSPQFILMFMREEVYHFLPVLGGEVAPDESTQHGVAFICCNRLVVRVLLLSSTSRIFHPPVIPIIVPEVRAAATSKERLKNFSDSSSSWKVRK